MAGGPVGDPYSIRVAYIYIFNLIVGVGALALPLGFKSAGLILGLIFLAGISFLAFVTVTWIIESLAAANAVIAIDEKSFKSTSPSQSVNNSEVERLLTPPYHESVDFSDDGANIFEIKRRVELGQMSELFMGSIGQKIFYAILIIYLYGDLAIYAVTVPKSLAAVTGGFHVGSIHFTNESVYYLYLTIFSVCIIPFTFFNFQKTKWMQYATLATRNSAFVCMIILGIVYIAQGNGASASELPWFDISGLPTLFGVSIYAFMCHHSLPSIVTPVKNKDKNLTKLFAADFISVYTSYALLCVSALFAYGAVTNPQCQQHPGPSCTIQQLYTLNFQSFSFQPIAVYLALFPVFTLSTNFPLISITLRNNLLQLITYKENTKRQGLRHTMFSFLAVLPPICIAYGTRDVDMLVSITGSYAGLGIMFVIPACLIIYSRRKVNSMFGPVVSNPYQSPFVHKAWIYVILVACGACVFLVTFNHIYKAVHK